MSRKSRLSLALSCVLLIIVGLLFWKDYSRRSFERKVDAATRTNDVPTLIEALESKDEHLLRKAAEAIARVGADARPAIPALIQALSTEDTSFTNATHTSIVKAIGSVGPDAKPAVPHLLKLLGQRDSPGFTNSRDRAAIDALGQIGPAAAAAIPMLLDHLNRQNALDRHATIQALAKIGPNSRDVVAAFMEILENNLVLAGQVVNALKTMGPEATEAVRAYIDEIFDQIGKGDGFVRLKEAGGTTFFIPIEAQRNMGSLGELVTPFLRAALNDDREAVRVISAYTLVDQGENASEVVKVLVEALDKPQYRGGAVGALTKLGPSAQAALPALRSLAANVADDSPFATMLDKAIHAIEADRTESADESKLKEER